MNYVCQKWAVGLLATAMVLSSGAIAPKVAAENWEKKTTISVQYKGKNVPAPKPPKSTPTPKPAPATTTKTSDVNSGLSSTQASAADQMRQAAKDGKISWKEAHAAVENMRNINGFSGGADGSSHSSYSGSSKITSETLDTYQKAAGINNTEHNNSETKAILSGNYKNDGSGMTSYEQTESNNATFYEAGVYYVKSADGSWKPDASQAADSNAKTLTPAQVANLIKYKTALSNGTMSFDEAHAAAEAVRKQAGYSGGADGSIYNADGSQPVSNPSSPNSGRESNTPVTPAKTYYTVICGCGEHGSVTPRGEGRYLAGSDLAVTITPAAGYRCNNVRIDGIDYSGRDGYTFHDLKQGHTLWATFESMASIDSVSGDLTGLTRADTTKSGYGVGAALKIDVTHATIDSVTAHNSATGHTISLYNAGGTWVYPVNRSSNTGARVDYIPVSRKNGTYTVTFTVAAHNSSDASVKLSKTITRTFRINGSMYDDDVAADK